MAEAVFSRSRRLRSSMVSLESLDRYFYLSTNTFALPTSLGRKNGKSIMRYVFVCPSVCVSHHSGHALHAHHALHDRHSQELVKEEIGGAKAGSVEHWPRTAGNPPPKSAAKIGR